MSNTARKKVRLTSGDVRFTIINYAILAILFIVILYPLYWVLIASISAPTAISTGEVLLFPKGITLEGYKAVFTDGQIMRGYGNSLLYTSVGIAFSLITTIPMAYALSRRDMAGRRLVNLLVVFTMFFGGGMIPTYLVINSLHMIDTIWALVIPFAVVPYNLIICRSFFENSIPTELREAASLDGCNDFQFFFKIVIPLSGAVIAIMILFYGVSQWNTYFNALIYIKDSEKYPLQLVLRNILILNQVSVESMGDSKTAALRQERAELIKYVSIIVSSLPLLILYPFVQKYFVKGVMIGAVKG